MRPALAPLVLALAAVAFQGGWASLRESQTWDEALAVAAGFLHVETGDFELYYENPPLLGLLVYPPLKLAGTETPAVSPEELRRVTPAQYGDLFFYQSQNDHRRLLVIARSMVLMVTLCGVGAVVLWSYQLFGKRGAWLAAVLCAFEPNWLAHGHLTAVDGLATSTIALAAFATVRMLERPTLGRALAAGAFTGLAWSAKHTALLLWPFLGLVLLMGPLLARRMGQGTRENDFGSPRHAVRLLPLFGVIVATGLLVVGASYNLSFRYDLYAKSLSGIYNLGSADYENYLCGTFRTASFPQYYLVALFLKTPLGFLPLAPIGLVAAVRSGRIAAWLPAAVMAALVLAATAANPHNLGIRHVVPAIPFFIVFASGALSAVSLRGRRNGWRSAVVVGLVALGAAESIRQTPDHISFFNVAAGGPQGGIACLDDSNIDWGQDLVRLAELQREEQIDNLAFMYFGSANPSAYGVTAGPLTQQELVAPRPDRVYAVSVQALIRLPRLYGPEVDWLRLHRPWRVAGNSIYLYRFP
jgi:hypothetical protein